MNFYKIIFRSKSLRIKILEALSFVSDPLMIKVQYFLKTGRFLNLRRPVRFTEKLQWYKVFYRDVKVTQCSDKFDVRGYVKEKGLGHILNDLYGVWPDSKSVDFSVLPSSFIFKATHGSGTNIIVKDKDEVDEEALRLTFDEWLEYDGYSIGREWGYKNIQPKIIAEKLLSRDSNDDLPDFKFFCFDGEVYCLYVMVDYVDNHDSGRLAFFDREFRPLNVYRRDFKPLKDAVKKPKNFSQMVDIAEKLAKGFPHVRVDLYNIEGSIVFGEMTFYNASGYTVFDPDSFDFELGRQFYLRDC